MNFENSKIAEEIALNVIKNLENSDKKEWNQLQIEISGILNANQDYRKTKSNVERILNTNHIKTKVKNPNITLEDIELIIQQEGGLSSYQAALSNLLRKDSEYGMNFYSKIKEMSEKLYNQNNYSENF